MAISGDWSADWSPLELPYLTTNNSAVTSPKSNVYNCIAWAVGDMENWWWPFSMAGVAYWPKGIRRELSVDAFVEALGTQGFTICANDKLEKGTEKIALYAKRVHGLLIPAHAARQLESGEWTSKLGPLVDVKHPTRDAVNGPLYGETVQFLSRPRLRQ